MRRVDIPTARLRRYAMAAAESGIAEQQVIATEASTDAPRPLAAADLARAGGAITVTLSCMPPRAAAESGSEGRPEETDLAIEARSAEILERMVAPIAAAMVRGAAYGRAALATGAAFRTLGGRP